MDIFNIYLPIADIHFNFLILLAIGFSVGTIGGLSGTGGSAIVTPALNIFGFPMSFAVGTGLLNVYGPSIVGVRKHAKLGNVNLKVGILVGLGMLLGVELGSRIVLFLDKSGSADSIIRYVYMVLLVGLSGYIFYDYYTKGKNQTGNSHDKLEKKRLSAAGKTKLPRWLPFMLGIGIGLLSGFLGVGGGFALVPSFIYLLRLPTSIAVGSSLLCCTMSGAYGGFTYVLKGRVEIVAVLFMLLGAALGAQIGASAVKYIRGYRIRSLYGGMLFLSAFSVFLKQLGLARIAGYIILSAALFVCAIIITYMLRGLIKERKLGHSDI